MKTYLVSEELGKYYITRLEEEIEYYTRLKLEEKDTRFEALWLGKIQGLQAALSCFLTLYPDMPECEK